MKKRNCLTRWVERRSAIGRLVGLATLLGCAGLSATAQGFAGLGQQGQGFAQVRPGVALTFPRDHGAHPDFRIEWWYLTANLTGPDGREYGIQWTLFRSALARGEAEGWQSPQLWMGHAAVTTASWHRFAERRARGGIGQAGVTLSPFTAWIDDWQMTGPDDLSRLHLTARAPDFAYDMNLIADGPLVLHGQDGFSVKSPDGQASYYYSQPGYRVTGRLILPDGAVTVAGRGWLDREWSSQPLSSGQTGWDWFSLRFEGGEKLMAFRLRGARGTFTAATWIDARGQATPLPDGAFRATPLARTDLGDKRVPTKWKIRLPVKRLEAEVEAINPRAWMGTSVPYWEGPVRVRGSHSGIGYLEMTGYE